MRKTKPMLKNWVNTHRKDRKSWNLEYVVFEERNREMVVLEVVSPVVVREWLIGLWALQTRCYLCRNNRHV